MLLTAASWPLIIVFRYSAISLGLEYLNCVFSLDSDFLSPSDKCAVLPKPPSNKSSSCFEEGVCSLGCTKSLIERSSFGKSLKRTTYNSSELEFERYTKGLSAKSEEVKTAAKTLFSSFTLIFPLNAVSNFPINGRFSAKYGPLDTLISYE